MSKNGATPSTGSNSPARRIVLLSGDNDSAVKTVLAEFDAADGAKADVHEKTRQLAIEHPGKCLAIEWQGSEAWVRFLWCRRQERAEEPESPALCDQPF